MAKSKAESDAPKVNKSKAIRDYLTENPKAANKDVIAALAEKGIPVIPTLVYFIKSKMNRDLKRAKRAKVQATSRLSGASDPVQLVRQVKSLALIAGGYQQLKELIDVMAE